MTPWPRVCLSVRQSQAGIASERPDGLRWFWARSLPSTFPTLCREEIRLSPKYGYFSLSLSLWKFVYDDDARAVICRRHDVAVTRA